MKSSIKNKIIIFFSLSLVANLIISNVLILGTRDKIYVELIIIGQFIITACFVVFFTKRIMEMFSPLDNFIYISKKIADGDNPNQTIYAKTNDEIQDIAENFNTINKKLKDTIKELNENSYEMRTILSGMTNGVIAVDNKNNVILINSFSEGIFKVKNNDVIGKKIDHISEFKNIIEDLNSLTLQKKYFKTERNINGEKIYSVKYNLMSNNLDPNRVFGTVIILEDITELKKLEDMRKEFVANVSHELKTPLTSIKGFVETLKTNDIKDSEILNKFLDIIDIEANRLTYLIEDILTLSEIENDIVSISKEKFNMRNMVEEIETLLSYKIKKKKINLEVKNELGILYLEKTWISQILINLMDNAVKYTPEYGEVKVYLYKENNFVKFKVEDTGIGIEEKHLDRIFERFYRADKSRSRLEGGTGLGLSIVKNIVISLNGTIEVQSKINEGTVFVVSIPIEKRNKLVL